MPLDAADIERITTIVEKSAARIEEDVNKLMPRMEYEKGHTELYNRTVKNEQSIQEVVKWAMEEHEKLAKRSDERFKELKADIKEVAEQVDGVKNDISAGRVTTIRYIITVLVSIGIGITIPVLLKVIGG